MISYLVSVLILTILLYAVLVQLLFTISPIHGIIVAIILIAKTYFEYSIRSELANSEEIKNEDSKN
jgi:hypothetical protein